MTLPALVAGLVGGLLAAVGFFGPGHTGLIEALQSAAACLLVGFMAGVMMAVANRVLWAYRWVPGGRAAVASALVPVLAAGAPVYNCRSAHGAVRGRLRARCRVRAGGGPREGLSPGCRG